MSSISFIGSGNMASAIGARAVKGGNAVEMISRDAAKADALAGSLGGGATAGKFGAAPAGEIVILSVPYTSAVQVVAQYGDALAGKIIVDVSNTFNADATRLVTPDGTSAAQEIAKAAPASAHVVKAFNTIFAHLLTEGRSIDAFIAGDDAAAKGACQRSSRASGCVRWTPVAWRWRAGSRERACSRWAWPAMAWGTTASPWASASATDPSAEGRPSVRSEKSKKLSRTVPHLLGIPQPFACGHD
jgi:8-hydroxy-5-deazaflavin:NADPH oxidoreductase